MAQKKWTDEEIAIIYQYAYSPIREIVNNLPGRNKKTVYWKLTDLGYKRDMFKRYTQEEDDYIRANYQKKGNREMAKHLKRTEKSLAKRMIVLGLKRTVLELYELKSKNAGCFRKGRKSDRLESIGTLHLIYDQQTESHFYRIKTNEGFVRFSRYLYEQYNNVKLTRNDVVFHKDGNSLNVLKENLELVTRSQLLEKNNMNDDAFIKRIFRVDADCVDYVKEKYPELVELKKNEIRLNKKIKEYESESN